jgi:hypothetical protein
MATTEREKRNRMASLAGLLLLSVLNVAVYLWYVHLALQEGYFSTVFAVRLVKMEAGLLFLANMDVRARLFRAVTHAVLGAQRLQPQGLPRWRTAL